MDKGDGIRTPYAPSVAPTTTKLKNVAKTRHILILGIFHFSRQLLAVVISSSISLMLLIAAKGGVSLFVEQVLEHCSRRRGVVGFG